MGTVREILARHPCGLPHLFQFAYQLGLWREDTQGWFENDLWCFWLALEDQDGQALEHFRKIRNRLARLSFISRVDVEPYFEDQGHVDQYGDVMGPLSGERWRIAMSRMIRFDHGLYRMARH